MKITTALERIELGNLSHAKGVGKGVMEYRVDVGPGYRIYFGRIGNELVIGNSVKKSDADVQRGG